MSQGIDFNQTNELCKCIICNWYYFLKINFRFRPKVCDGCHNLMQNVKSFNDVAIVFVKGNDYKIYSFSMSKDDAIRGKSGTYRI